jgi:hypothetical protein
MALPSKKAGAVAIPKAMEEGSEPLPSSFS